MCADHPSPTQTYFILYHRSQIQRPATALPKSASSSSMKKTYLTTFEFEKTEMEMPKLNQFDLDELFKPVEMPKIK